MSVVDAIWHRLRVLMRPRTHERELREEMEFHLSLAAMQREHAGRGSLTGAAATFAARQRFGNVTRHQEETRIMAGLSSLDHLRQDLRFAWRSFARTPGFTIVAVLTLAIGIGANTAIFSAIDALLLRPLPFAQPERLMKVSLTRPALGQEKANTDAVWSFPKFVVVRDAQTVFSSVSLYTEFVATLRAGGDAERLRTEVIDASYLPTLGVQPLAGRNISPEENAHAGGPNVVLLSYALWSRRFNADPKIIGTAISVDNTPQVVIGVLPPNFRGLSGQADIWLSLMATPAEELSQAWSHSYVQIARLAPGVTVAQAKAQVLQLGKRVDEVYPHPEIKELHGGAIARELDGVRVDPLVRRSLYVLLGAVGCVLLIACANVANLFLVRAIGRSREIAVRLAVGAGRGRLIRQLLTESLLLSTIGGAAGVLVAYAAVRLLSSINPTSAFRVHSLSGIGAVSFADIHVNALALAVAAALSIATGLVFGLVPALKSTRLSLVDALKASRGAGHSRVWRALTSRNLLVIMEIAVALVLLAGSGLMMRSLGKLMAVSPGFSPEQVLSLRLNTREGFSRDSLPGFYDQLLARLTVLSGVTGVALQDCPPLNGGCSSTIAVRRDRPEPKAGTEEFVGIHWVSPAWSAVLRVPLHKGRLFTSGDRAGTQKVIVVSESAAQRLWPNEDPIGKPVSVGQGGFWKDTAYVIGVVGDVRYRSMNEPPTPDVYLSYYQSMRGRMMIALRTTGNPLALATPARQLLHDMAPDLPVYDIRPMTSFVDDATAYARFSTALLVLFGGVALVLATLGTYGVIAFGVSQRTREIGIRIALGARSVDVVRMIVRQGLAFVAVGATIGLLIAIATTGVLRSLLFDVAPSDPMTFAGIVVVLGVAVLVACWIPARRATRVQPTSALRSE